MSNESSLASFVCALLPAYLHESRTCGYVSADVSAKLHPSRPPFLHPHLTLNLVGIHCQCVYPLLPKLPSGTGAAPNWRCARRWTLCQGDCQGDFQSWAYGPENSEPPSHLSI